MLNVLWGLIALMAIVIGSWLLWSRRSKSSDIQGSKIGGQTCPDCGSDEIYWAGYSDRKECGECSRVFS